uniref:Amino acid transporter transmembrane domain-containing protein n=1 Tax=Strigamia maritima TaxID=126957 RepID=T1J036_STRMM
MMKKVLTTMTVDNRKDPHSPNRLIITQIVITNEYVKSVIIEDFVINQTRHVIKFIRNRLCIDSASTFDFYITKLNMPLSQRITNKQEYSKLTGSVFIFNLIVGTGALTLPYAFSRAGWLMGLFVISILAFMSFITVTFVIESMATTNAILHWQKLENFKSRLIKTPEGNERIEVNSLSQSELEVASNTSIMSSNDSTEEYAPLLENSEPHRLPMPIDYYSITEAVEMGQMISVYFKKIGITIFYICICIYLYGDLAIYATAVAKSLRDVTCYNIDYSTFVPESHIGNNSCNEKIPLNESCWGESLNITRSDAYKLYIAIFTLVLGPFVFFNVQKTKYLQMITSAFRWIAFLSMIILTIIHLAKGQGKGTPKIVNWKHIPDLFGVCIYSFMCHHSLPSLITPISDKRKLQRLFAVDYSVIVSFYLLLSLTGVFTFSSVNDLYTLNFQPDRCNLDDPNSITTFVAIQYFLALFPVFTLSTNFPIIGITLRNNLRAIILKENANWWFKNIVTPFITILPPVFISLMTEDVGQLVGYTGTYAGSSIQYIIPVVLVYKSRKMAETCLGNGVKNIHVSVFRHNYWLIIVVVWSISCVILATISKFF